MYGGFHSILGMFTAGYSISNCPFPIKLYTSAAKDRAASINPRQAANHIAARHIP
jgi:hypothetical protein